MLIYNDNILFKLLECITYISKSTISIPKEKEKNTCPLSNIHLKSFARSQRYVRVH